MLQALQHGGTSFKWVWVETEAILRRANTIDLPDTRSRPFLEARGCTSKRDENARPFGRQQDATTRIPTTMCVFLPDCAGPMLADTFNAPGRKPSPSFRNATQAESAKSRPSEGKIPEASTIFRAWKRRAALSRRR